MPRLRPAPTFVEVPVSNTLEQIASLMGGLSTSERHVARVVLERPYDLLDCSAAELGRRSGTSSATAVRTCRKLGFAGLADLRLRLARDLGWSAPFQRPTEQPAGGSLLLEIFDEAARSLPTLVDRDTLRAFRRATKILGDAKRVLAVANGPSSVFALDFVYSARLSGLEAEFWPDSIMQTLVASKLGRSDLCVAFSISGVNALTVEAIDAARRGHAKILVVTGFRQSQLADLATVAVAIEALDNSTSRHGPINAAGMLLAGRALVLGALHRGVESTVASSRALDETREVFGRFSSLRVAPANGRTSPPPS